MADERHLPFLFKVKNKKKPRCVFYGSVVRLYLEQVKLPNGHRMELEVVRHPGASAVVPILNKDRVVLIRQYRHAVGGYLYEIPAGKLMEDENPLPCARRELEEETGYRGGQFKRLGSIFTAPGFTDEVIHLYQATGLIKTRQKLESCEVLKVMSIPILKIPSMIKAGKIRDAKTIIGLQMACFTL